MQLKKLLKAATAIFMIGFCVFTNSTLPETVSFQMLGTSFECQYSELPSILQEFSLRNGKQSVFDKEIESALDILLKDSFPDYREIDENSFFKIVPDKADKDWKFTVIKCPLSEFMRYSSSKNKHRLEMSLDHDGILEAVVYFPEDKKLEDPKDLKRFIFEHSSAAIADLMMGELAQYSKEQGEANLKRMNDLLEQNANGEITFEEMRKNLHKSRQEEDSQRDKVILYVYPSRAYLTRSEELGFSKDSMEGCLLARVSCSCDTWTNMAFVELLQDTFMSKILSGVITTLDTRKPLELDQMTVCPANQAGMRTNLNIIRKTLGIPVQSETTSSKAGP